MGSDGGDSNTHEAGDGLQRRERTHRGAGAAGDSQSAWESDGDAAMYAEDTGCGLASLALKLLSLDLGSGAALGVRETVSLRRFKPAEGELSFTVSVDGMHTQFPSNALGSFIRCVNPSFNASFRGYKIPTASRAQGRHSVRVMCIENLRLQVYLVATRRLQACVTRFIDALNSGGAAFGKGQLWEVVEHGNKGRSRLVRSVRPTSGPYSAHQALQFLEAAVAGTRGVSVLVRGFGQDAVVATTDDAELCGLDTWLSFMLQLHDEDERLTADSGVDVCTQVVTPNASASLMLDGHGAWQELLPEQVRLFPKLGLVGLVDANGTFSAAARDRHLDSLPAAPELLRLSKGVNFYSSQVYALAGRQHPALKCLQAISPQQLSARAVEGAVDTYATSMSVNVLDAVTFRAFPLRLEVKNCNVREFMSAVRALLMWCTSQHARYVRAMRKVSTHEFRKSAGVLYRSIALEMLLCSSLQMWSAGTNHNVPGWQRHERVLQLAGQVWQGVADATWVELQVAQGHSFLELPIDVTVPSTSGLPMNGFTARFNRQPTTGPLGECVRRGCAWRTSSRVAESYKSGLRRGRAGWLLDELVALAAAAEAHRLSLGSRFALSAAALDVFPARACALVVFLVSALECLHHAKAVPHFEAGPTVRPPPSCAGCVALWCQPHTSRYGGRVDCWHCTAFMATACWVVMGTGTS